MTLATRRARVLLSISYPPRQGRRECRAPDAPDSRIAIFRAAPSFRSASVPHLHRPGVCRSGDLVVFATILLEFRFVLLDPPAVMPEARITLRPAGGMKMIV